MAMSKRSWKHIGESHVGIGGAGNVGLSVPKWRNQEKPRRINSAFSDSDLPI